jgi:acyl-lipid omega-6 desaturase (Delta-12 desaturase)
MSTILWRASALSTSLSFLARSQSGGAKIMIDSSRSAALASASNSARDIARALAPYREPALNRSVAEIAVTALPLVGLWVAMWGALHISYWLSLALAPLAAGFLVRLFMIQHDCGHGAFFRNREANDWVGRVLGVLTLTPYDYWKRTHAAHHATSGNLDRRGMGDIDTLTVREYLAGSWRRRLAYRIHRHPSVMFGIGPAYLFLIQQRAPLGLMRGAGWRPWISTMATNAAIAAAAALLMILIGVGPFLAIHVPIVLLAASIGVWLFFVQHQFDRTTWSRESEWSHPESALLGSSHYDLPIVLRWFSANIGVHHVHHLSSRIPFYRLREVLMNHPELAEVGRLTIWQSLRCVNYALWDEDARRLISFRELRRRRPADASPASAASD